MCIWQENAHVQTLWLYQDEIPTLNDWQSQRPLEIEFIYFVAADCGSRISQPYRPDLNDLHIEVPLLLLPRPLLLHRSPAEKPVWKGARLARDCACLCNDWLGAGLQANIGWQAHRNSDYSEVVTLVVVVWALLSPPAHCLGCQSWWAEWARRMESAAKRTQRSDSEAARGGWSVTSCGMSLCVTSWILPYPRLATWCEILTML